MKHVIRYLLEGSGEVPSFVLDGGYFALNEDLVGISVDSSKRHLPTSVIKLTRAELKTRILQTVLTLSREQLSSEQADEIIDQLLAKHGMESYE